QRGDKKQGDQQRRDQVGDAQRADVGDRRRPEQQAITGQPENFGKPADIHDAAQPNFGKTAIARVTIGAMIATSSAGRKQATSTIDNLTVTVLAASSARSSRRVRRSSE